MLSDLADVMGRAFVASGCPVPVLFGEQWLDENFDGSRVVVCPSSDTFVEKLAGGYAGTHSGHPLRSVATRRQGADITIFAAAPILEDRASQLRADHAVLDAIINMTVLALSKTASGVTYRGPGAFLNDEAVHVRRGLTYVLSVSVDVPILDIPFPNIAITPCDITFISQQAAFDVTVKESDDAQVQFVVPVP